MHWQSLPLFFVTRILVADPGPWGSNESLLRLLRSPSPKSQSCYAWQGAEAHLVMGSLPTTSWFLADADPGPSTCLPSSLGWTRYLWTSQCHPRIQTPMSTVCGWKRQGPKTKTPTDLATRPSDVRPGRVGPVDLRPRPRHPRPQGRPPHPPGVTVDRWPWEASMGRPQAASGHPLKPNTLKKTKSNVAGVLSVWYQLSLTYCYYNPGYKFSLTLVKVRLA